MVLNIAHRGARSLAPENTLAAARKALDAGADLWETDLAVTTDGALVLFHDETLNRTTDVRRVFSTRSPWRLCDFSLAELGELDCGSWFLQSDPFGQIAAGRLSPQEQQSYRNMTIPTLEEALIFTREAHWRINVELKRLPPQLDGFPIVDRVLALVDKLRFDSRDLVLSSFEHQWLRKIQVLRPDIEVQALIGSSRIAPLNWGNLEFKTYNARHTLVDVRLIGELVDKGVGVNLWTVNDEVTMRRFIHAGAAGIFTDFPQRMARIVGRRPRTATAGNFRER